MSTILLLISSVLFIPLNAQTAPEIEWEKSYGGSLHEQPGEIINTSDGGYIFIGSSMSSDGDVSTNKGQSDLWVVKLDNEGTLMWEKSYGGSDLDSGHTIIELTNGDGYIVAGEIQSSDGDVTENDFFVAWWILRLDLEGNIIWDKTLGGFGYNRPNSAVQANDGNIIIAGLNDMDGGDVTINYGGADFWVVKMDIGGNLIWEKSYGGSGDESPEQIIQTMDGNFLLVGFSNSSDGHISAPQGDGDNDYWVIKIDGDGNLLWEKSYGGSGGSFFGDWAQTVVESTDGEFIIAGHSSSMDGQVTGNHGGTDDFWIIKIDEVGNLVWEKSYGGFASDIPRSIIKTDGGYVIAGESASIDGDITNHYGEFPGFEDVWVIKIDETGDLLWEKSFGGIDLDWSRDMILSPEGEIIVLAETYSESGDGDVSHNHGESDVWILKLHEENMGVSETILQKADFTIYPNPFTNQVNIQLPKNTTGNYTFKVSDLTGKTIYSKTQSEKSFVWNGSSLPKGVYIISIENNGKVIANKVIKK